MTPMSYDLFLCQPAVRAPLAMTQRLLSGKSRGTRIWHQLCRRRLAMHIRPHDEGPRRVEQQAEQPAEQPNLLSPFSAGQATQPSQLVQFLCPDWSLDFGKRHLYIKRCWKELWQRLTCSSHMQSRSALAHIVDLRPLHHAHTPTQNFSPALDESSQVDKYRQL